MISFTKMSPVTTEPLRHISIVHAPFEQQTSPLTAA
jgi:hypothetical protein